MSMRTHILFWLFVVLLLTLAFGPSYNSYEQAFYFVAMLLPVIVSTSYFFNYYLVPQYLFKQRYFKFFLYFIYTIIVSTYLEMIVLVGAFILLANYQYENMNPVTTDVFVLLATLYMIVFAKAFMLQFKKFQQMQIQLKELAEKKVIEKKEFISVRADRKNVQIALKDICYIESLSDYLKIHLDNGNTILTKETISGMYKNLPASFLRIHRSFVINIHYLEAYTKEFVLIKGKELSISRSYKKQVLAKLDNSKVEMKD